MTERLNRPYEPNERVFSAFVRFLLSGGFNTVATYGIYLVLLRLIPYRISYTISYLTGIVISYFLNRLFVFRSSRRGLTSVALFPLVYLVQYLAGLAIVSLWTGFLGWNAAYAPIPAILLTIPATFATARWVFVKKRDEQPQ